MRKSYLVLAVFFVIALLILLNNTFPPVKGISSLVQNVFSPPKSALYDIKTKMGGDSPEIKKLKNDNSRILKKLVNYENLKKDNDALRSQFETSQTQGYNLLPGRVVGSQGSGPSPSYLIVALGEKDGVKKGMAVIFGDNLVGKITSVKSAYSRVELLTGPGFSTVAVSVENNASGIVHGQDDFILFDHVAIKDKIIEGEGVKTAGQIDEHGLGVPADLLIGKISKVNRNDALAFQTAKVESSIPFAHLATVFVILSSK